jgi:excinuclease ABC subunit B
MLSLPLSFPQGGANSMVPSITQNLAAGATLVIVTEGLNSADVMTGSMREAIAETARRRQLQLAYNREHGITPETIKKDIQDVLASIYEHDYYTVPALKDEEIRYIPREEIPALMAQLDKEMRAAAKRLEFEKAAELRDRIAELEKRRLGIVDKNP